MWGGMAERCRRDAAQGQPLPSLRHTSFLMPTQVGLEATYLPISPHISPYLPMPTQVGLEAGATFHRSLA